MGSSPSPSPSPQSPSPSPSPSLQATSPSPSPSPQNKDSSPTRVHCRTRVLHHCILHVSIESAIPENPLHGRPKKLVYMPYTRRLIGDFCKFWGVNFGR